MEDLVRQKDELYERMRQCENFVWLICVLGITLPLIASVFVLEKTTHLLTIVGILTAITPTIFAFAALISYHKAHKAESDNIRKRKGTWGNILLYIGGGLSIFFVSGYVILTGGIQGNLMAFYFVYVPSTTAVAFRTRWGLLIVSAISASCLAVLYYYFYEYGILYEHGEFQKMDSIIEPHKYYYLGFSILQIFLIIILELRTNKISK